MVIAVRVRTRAAADRLDGWRDGRLLVHTTAPPVEGRANEATCHLIARAVQIAPSHVQVARGDRARDKLVRILGVPRAHALQALGHPDYTEGNVRPDGSTSALGARRPRSARSDRPPSA